MKIKPSDITSFLSKPPASCRIFLIYGADEGLVKVQRDALLKGLRIDASDPFATTQLEASAIISEPSLLYDSLSALSLMGDAPCVVVREASNKLTEHVKEIAAHASRYNFFILTAGELEASGSLRALCEDTKQTSIATIACYRAEGKELAITLRGMLKAAQVRVDEDALQLLVSMLGNDRAITHSEIEKILLYLGNDKHLTAEIVQQCCADNQHVMISEALLSWWAGNTEAFIRMTERLLRAGESPVALVRVLQYQAVQLIHMVEKCAKGASPNDVVNGHRPFIHFRDRPLYIAILQRWKTPYSLMKAQVYMVRLEEQVKRTGFEPFMLLQHLLAIGKKH